MSKSGIEFTVDTKNRKAFAERLEKALEHSKFKSVSSAAKAAGVSQQAFHNWLKAEAEPARDRLIATTDVLGVNLLWLVTGEGPMNGVPTTESNQIELSRMQNVIEQTEKFLLNNELVLEPEDKARLFIAVYNVLTEKYKDEAFDQDFLDAHPNVIVMAALGK